MKHMPGWSPREASDARKLRQVIEVRVPGIEDGAVLEHERRNPHVIRRDRGPLLSELAVHCRVVVRCLLVGKKYGDTSAKEKASEAALVLCAL